jgi:hypothetical protein
MGEPTLRVIAHELVASIKSSVSVDWMHREAARARMRVLVSACFANTATRRIDSRSYRGGRAEAVVHIPYPLGMGPIPAAAPRAHTLPIASGREAVASLPVSCGRRAAGNKPGPVAVTAAPCRLERRLDGGRSL